MRKRTNIILCIISILSILLGIVFLKFGFNIKENKNVLYNYNISKNTDYQVNLEPNIFYDEVMPSGKYYASKAIKSIDLKYRYNINGDKNVKIKYNYNITADLIGNMDNVDKSSNEIWNKKFILFEKEEEEVLDKLELEKDINLDYAYYKELVNEYEDTYDIKINADLKIYFNIYYDLYIDGIEKHFEDNIELDMPVNNIATHIEKNYIENISDSIDLEKNHMGTICLSLFIIGPLCIIIGIILIVIILFKEIKDKNEYVNSIKYITNNYSDLIVNVENEPYIDNLKSIKVKNVSDLVNLAEQNKVNIIHYTVENESRLYVLLHDFVYIYNKMK